VTSGRCGERLKAGDVMAAALAEARVVRNRRRVVALPVRKRPVLRITTEGGRVF
jgi:hypothetical protein